MHSISKMRALLSSISVSTTTTTTTTTVHPPTSLPSAFKLPPLPGLLSLARTASALLRPRTPSRSGLLIVRACDSRRADRCGTPMDARQPHSGQIHVICGPMFAGKTTALLRRVQAERNSGRKVAIIKSNKDNRYGLDSIVTHDGARMPCWALPDLSTFRATLGAEAYDKLDVIGIDEAQFFEDLHDFCCKAADHDGKIVVVAGLDGDYLRRSFGSVLDLIPIADSVTKLTARCELCGKRAFFTLRKTDETQTELVGGADVYMPVCRHHYVNGQVVIEAARLVLESRKLRCGSYIEAAPNYS